ncbi:MAG: RNA polymerase sigma-70 factor (ECF subfamily) [Verrucomicrobiales bacterium]|jgi:RNA polymerase sigma-70 factor (ECF subfamily)
MKVTDDHSEADAHSQVEFQSAIHAVRDKDPQQFANLHREYFNLVMATAYRVLNDRHDAEDVAQEVFASLWKKAHLYDSQRGKPSTWITTIARNRAIDRLRSKQRRSQLRDDVQRETNPEILRERDDVVSSVGREEESKLVRSAVMKLKPEQRQAIEITFFGGLSQSEAAEALGTPLGTIKARVRRGLMQLRTSVPQLMA